jgi:hypothetical protein
MTDAKQGQDGKGAAASTGQTMTETTRNWMMAGLTVIFIVLYVGALFGWIPGHATTQDQQTINRIEAIVFVIVGYYFGRLPAQANEATLKQEVSRQSGRAETAEQQKTTALQQQGRLEEKVKNARAALTTVPESAKPEMAPMLGRAAGTTETVAVHPTVMAALRVLDS